MPFVIKMLFSAHPCLIPCHVVQAYQIPLHHTCDLDKGLMLVDTCHVEVTMEMRVITHLVFHGTAESNSQASDATHRFHIMAEDILACPLMLGIAIWAPWAHAESE